MVVLGKFNGPISLAVKLFKRIKRQLLAESRFSKYVLYATGEIVLVVIGILIALSINNANQARITREKEQAYLLSLKSEFVTSQTKLDNLMEVNKQNYEGAKQMLTYLENERSFLPEEKLSQLLFQSFAYEVAYNPNSSVLNEMISSGSLKDISNAELRVHLTTWESIIESIRIQEQDLRNQREKVRDMFRGEAGSIRTIFDHANITADPIGLPRRETQHSNLDLMSSRAFENNVLLFVLTSISTEQAHYHPLKKEISRILDLIDAEVEK